MTSWRWIGADVAFAVHDRQIAEHGGLDGLRDRGGVLSALAQPQNLAAYGNCDAADLAASYAMGIARNHPFADGNKRTAWVFARLFLADNDIRLDFTAIGAVTLMVALAAGTVTEAGLAAWFRARMSQPSA